MGTTERLYEKTWRRIESDYLKRRAQLYPDVPVGDDELKRLYVEYVDAWMQGDTTISDAARTAQKAMLDLIGLSMKAAS
jgi:hypothetical protein